MRLLKLTLFCSVFIFFLVSFSYAQDDNPEDSFEDSKDFVPDNEELQNSSASTTSTSTTTTTTTPKPSRKKSPFLQVRTGPKHQAQHQLKPKSPAILNTSSSDEFVQRKPLSETEQKPSKKLKQIHDYLIVVLLVAVMFAMGCSITWSQVRQKLNFCIILIA